MHFLSLKNTKFLKRKMQLSEITKHLEELAPLAYAEDFDNVGLLVGHSNDITGILVCHDALENVIDEAIAKKCNLVVCFHPIRYGYGSFHVSRMWLIGDQFEASP